jgi:pimeloyl-ACP methyl ester carboxylesterase
MSIPANEVMQIRFRTVNGITTRYAESDGHQDSFILLTCPWPESLYAFLPIWQPLSEHSHLLAIDLPGFGQSERRNDLLSPQAMGEFLIRLVDEWELDTPHVVGPDIGTAASLFAAARHPGKLRSLVIGNGGTAYPLQVGSLPDTFWLKKIGKEKEEANEIVSIKRQKTSTWKDDLNECIDDIMGEVARTSQGDVARSAWTPEENASTVCVGYDPLAECGVATNG